MDEIKKRMLSDIKKYLLHHGWVLNDGLFQEEFPMFTKYLTVEGIEIESQFTIETKRVTCINYSTGKIIDIPEAINRDYMFVKAMMDMKQKHLWEL